MGFNYQQTIGELIYAYTICRIIIAIAVITLSQFSQQPAKIYYEAFKQVFVHSNATKDYGLTYWRPKLCNDDLRYKPAPKSITPNQLDYLSTKSTRKYVCFDTDIHYYNEKIHL